MNNELKRQVIEAANETRQIIAALEQLSERTPYDEWRLKGLRRTLAIVPGLVHKFEQLEAMAEKIDGMKLEPNNGR